MTKCQQCGKETFLPFQCPYCKGYFCSEHRLPENHNCPEKWRARVPKKVETVPFTVEAKSPYEYVITYAPTLRPRKAIWFSTTELKHLAIGTLLVMAIGLSWMLFSNASDLLSVILAVTFTVSFLLHEIAHKITAQIYGLWAEFRLTLFGVLITVISIFSFFKIISPGAVMISGYASRETVGKTALSGPLTNILIALVCICVGLVTPSFPLIWVVAVFTAWINVVIALLNLVPFGIIDGYKIFSWNKKVWALAFLAAILLTLFVLFYFKVFLLF
ncbi:MAG: AN1-type zinc finger domain-containing protein [Candidatus Bathyarchaeia archaeon]